MRTHNCKTFKDYSIEEEKDFPKSLRIILNLSSGSMAYLSVKEAHLPICEPHSGPHYTDEKQAVHLLIMDLAQGQPLE